MGEYGIEGMKCHTCVGKITDALLEVGYKNVSASLNPAFLRLESDSSISRETLQEALAEVGDYGLVGTHAQHAPQPNDVVVAYIFFPNNISFSKLFYKVAEISVSELDLIVCTTDLELGRVCNTTRRVSAIIF